DLFLLAIERAGYRAGDEIFIALDVAASEFAESGGRYRLERERSVRTADEMIAFYESLCERYPIVSIEDGLGEDDWAGGGALARSERTAKYTQLLRIEEELGNAASCPGRSLYNRVMR